MARTHKVIDADGHILEPLDIWDRYIDDFVLPGGLAFSPDESVLYINDTRRGHIRAFDLLPNGTLAKQTDRVFADLRGTEPAFPTA